METRARYSHPDAQEWETTALTQERRPPCPTATWCPGRGPRRDSGSVRHSGELVFCNMPFPRALLPPGHCPRAPRNQAATTHEQEITRGTCGLSKDGSVGGPSLLPSNSPRCAANICAFRQQAEGSYRRTGPYLSNYKHMC